MKKKILLLCTFLISLFMFTNRASAIYMYIECEYTDACYRDTESFLGDIFDRHCQPEHNVWVPMTTNKGSLIYSVISTLKNGPPNGRQLFIDAGACYIKSEENYEKDCDDVDTFEGGASKIFTDGICPSLNSTRGFGVTSLIPVGTNGKVIERASLEENEYIIYSFNDSKGNPTTFIELYYQDGRYAFVGPDPTLPLNDEIQNYQWIQINRLGKDYFHVATNFDSLMIASTSSTINSNWTVCKKGKEDCINNHGYKVILDSKDNKYVIDNAVDSWLEKNNKTFSELENFSDFFDNNKKLMDNIEEFNKTIEQGDNYNFSEHGTTAEEMVSGIEKAYDVLSSFYDRNIKFIDYTDLDRTDADLDATDSALTYLFADYLKLDKDIVEFASKADVEHYLNDGLIRAALKEDISKSIEKKSNNNSNNALNANEKAAEYVLLLYTAVLHLDSNSLTLLPQNSNLSTRVFNLRDKKFPDLIEKYDLNIYPVVDCESLIGTDLLEKINSYLDIIKIAIPILLIGLGTIDFTKAVFAGDDELMKKSQKTFGKRLLIAILIFFIPTIVNFILQLANKVWPIIAPNSCGLLETKEKACYVCGNSNKGKYVWRTSEQTSSCTKYSSAKNKKDCEAMNNK